MSIFESNDMVAFVRVAVKKYIPEKPITDEWDVVWLCPVCTRQLMQEQKYCKECGQRIDWNL